MALLWRLDITETIVKIASDGKAAAEKSAAGWEATFNALQKANNEKPAKDYGKLDAEVIAVDSKVFSFSNEGIPHHIPIRSPVTSLIRVQHPSDFRVSFNLAFSPRGDKSEFYVLEGLHKETGDFRHEICKIDFPATQIRLTWLPTKLTNLDNDKRYRELLNRKTRNDEEDREFKSLKDSFDATKRLRAQIMEHAANWLKCSLIAVKDDKDVRHIALRPRDDASREEAFRTHTQFVVFQGRGAVKSISLKKGIVTIEVPLHRIEEFRFEQVFEPNSLGVRLLVEDIKRNQPK